MKYSKNRLNISWFGKRTAGAGGFTLTEVMVASSIIGVVFVAFGLFSLQALQTFKWLTATNVAHQQARQGIQNMLVDIHESPAPLMLVNVRGEPEPATGTFWGVVYQQLIAGPLTVDSDLSTGATTIDILTGSKFTPEIGQLLVIPNSSAIYEITAVGSTSGTGVTTVTFTPGITTNDNLSKDGSYNATDATSGGQAALGVYVTQRSCFLVRRPSANADFELRQYPMIATFSNANGTLEGESGGSSTYYVPVINGVKTNAIDNPSGYRIVSRGLRSVVDSSNDLIAPFSDPFSATNSTNRRAVAAVQLSLQDSTVSNLIADEQSQYHLNATTIFLNSMIPQKHMLTPRN